MSKRSRIFDKNYEDYCRRIQQVDLSAIRERLDIRVEENTAVIPFFNRTYRVSGSGILTPENETADYVTCVILAKYLLMCPDQPFTDEEWATFRDFRNASYFTNAAHFITETTTRITAEFSGRCHALAAACAKAGGVEQQMEPTWDLAFAFRALPRLSLLLLMNDADTEFPADSRLLFQRQAEQYLDPESLAMTASLLAVKLSEIDTHNKDGTDE